MRVGLGYDIHRLEAGRRLIIGGVPIPHTLGLAGHSDADVLLHALMDAILGALALGDIGTHFPPNDPKYRGISSLTLLRQVAALMRGAGHILVNADMVIVAEQPRISPHVELMRDAIRKILEVDLSCIGIKSTTNEGVGPEGRAEAISARAVVLLDAKR